MLRSLSAGISGMQATQEQMDVISNNIANAGTTAFKGGDVRFEDMFSQASKSASGATPNSGGTNASQVGMGVQVASVDTLETQGTPTSTGRDLDVAIDGEGFFMVGKGPAVYDAGITVDNAAHSVTPNTIGLDINYTRDGSFNLDDQGDLVTSDGSRILGYSVAGSDSLGATGADSATADGTVNFVDSTKAVTSDDTSLKTLKIPDTVVISAGVTAKVTSYSIAKDGLITAALDNGTVTAIGQIAMASFSNPAGLTNIGNNQFKISSNSGAAVVKSGLLDTTNDNSKGYGDLDQGSLEMSNVDLSAEFTNMIVTNRAFQANSKTITTSDEMLQDIIGLIR